MGADAPANCPACGSRLSRERWGEGLCPSCMIRLGLDVASVDAREAPTLEAASLAEVSSAMFSEGELLGDRYRIESPLGRGGMGEVWRAYDLKLRLDVALKTLHPDLFATEEGLELLRDEVRAAREVTSPNVCRLYDLVEVGGTELVSMEYVDGVTLLEHLREYSPLGLKEANEIASQLLAGLEAVHQSGLVHRDIKPENVMLTRTGRVVVMDFGLTSPSGTGSMAGTPAYMAPEQARGEAVDARADVFAAGMVLAEMLSVVAEADDTSRQRFWQAVRQEPPVLPESPWKAILQRALATESEERFASAGELARALEDVAFRVEGEDREQPYPGLAAFRQEDAEFFFGREAEVETLWKKLRTARLLGLIGPSGSGKSSFVNAGLLPARPEGWSCVRMAPGRAPFAALGRALLPELAGDPAAMEALVALEDCDPALEAVRAWTTRHGQTLLVVDQFEELFTQTPEEVQHRFAEFMGRAALDADVHILLSMRDDFLMHCRAHEALSPLFADLTALLPPMGASLRRAVVQPALRCGYRFEDESVVEAMLEEVARERGALPLIAFTAAQLWERRDRETGYLTRKAYEQLGGVAGALAQHAEATLDFIGEADLPIVRELFRNLVTAQGTRTSRGRTELLSVFEAEEGLGLSREGGEPAAQRAGRVLDMMVLARLLVSFELPPSTEEETADLRIEIVHESLLEAWPRLVRWRMQDAEGAKLRDELRDQAKLWNEHDRSPDYLWTGSAYLDYQAWRQRYPGGLTRLEDDYARAMTAHAERRRRRRRIAATVVVVLSLMVGAVTGALWLRSEAETRRAEAAKLLALAQLRFEVDPTEALAFTMASLELSDTEEARIFAMKALGAGPPVLALDPGRPQMIVPRFSRNGQWLSLAGVAREEVLVWHQDGSGPVVLDGHRVSPDNPIQTAWISGSELVTGHETEGRARIWSFPGGELRRQIDFEGRALWQAGESHLLATVFEEDAGGAVGIARLRSFRMPDGEPEELGTVVYPAAAGLDRAVFFDAGKPGWAYTKGSKVFYRPLPAREGDPDRLVGSHQNEARIVAAERDRLWTRDAVTGELRRWDPSAASAEPLEVLPPVSANGEDAWYRPVLDGRWLLEEASREGKARLWDPLSLPGADPREFTRSGQWWASALDFHPAGDWVLASTRGMTEVSFWPLRALQPVVVRGYDKWGRRPVAFTPDGDWLLSYWPKDKLRLWRLPGGGSQEIRELDIGYIDGRMQLTLDPAGERVFMPGYGGQLSVHSLESGGVEHLEGFSNDTLVERGAFSPSGRLIAAAAAWTAGEEELRVWDLDSGEIEAFELPEPVPGSRSESDGSTFSDAAAVEFLAFSDESTLFTAGRTGVLRWDLAAGTHERLGSAGAGGFAGLWMSGDRRQLMTIGEDPADERCGSFVLRDLRLGSAKELESFVTCQDARMIREMTFDDTLSVMAVGRVDGTIWVGQVDGGSPHLLTGHQGSIEGLAVSPDRRWIASSGEDKTLRLWPMPDLDEPPLHALHLEELLARLGSLTNLRAVRDEASSTGWSIEIGPFPGWEKVPQW